MRSAATTESRPLLDLLREEYDALGMVSYTGDGDGGWIPDLRAQDIEGIMRLLMAAGSEFGRLIVADRAASVAHDFIHGLNGVTKEQADEAIWTIHNHLRPLFEEAESNGWNMLTLDEAVEHYTQLGLDVSVRKGLLCLRVKHGVNIGELRLAPTQLDRRYIAHELAKLRRGVEA